MGRRSPADPVTEAEWLTGDDVYRMSLHVTKGSPRKLRLFAVACCRRLPARLIDDDCRRLLDAARALADGRVTPAAVRKLERPLLALATEFEGAWRAALHGVGPRNAAARTYRAVAACAMTAQADRYMIRRAADEVLGAVSKPAPERRHQAALLRDIYGNPFRPVAFDKKWRSADATALATTMDESGDLATMPILADALEEAGCDSNEVLAHCRGGGPHVPGCWVVDLVLGKE